MPRWSPLVAIETRGSQPPFFCVHDVNGTVHSFYQLARALGADRPFYGLQAAGMTAEMTTLTTVEALADRYVDAIRTIQPRGPYLLGGYSLGCQIALAMARQLQASGETVAHLLLLDGRPPKIDDGEGRMTTTQWLLAKAYSLAWRQGKPLTVKPEALLAQVDEPTLRALPFAEQVAHLNEHLHKAQWERLATTTVSNDYATFQYLSRLPYPSAAPVDLPATFFYTQGHFDLRYPRTQEPSLGWHAFLPNGLTCQPAAGNHLALLFPPYVQHLAQQMAACLQTSNAHQRSSVC